MINLLATKFCKGNVVEQLLNALDLVFQEFRLGKAEIRNEAKKYARRVCFCFIIERYERNESGDSHFHFRVSEDRKNER